MEEIDGVYKAKEIEKIDASTYIVYADHLHEAAITENENDMTDEDWEIVESGFQNADMLDYNSRLIIGNVKFYLNKVVEDEQERYCFIKVERDAQ